MRKYLLKVKIYRISHRYTDTVLLFKIPIKQQKILLYESLLESALCQTVFVNRLDQQKNYGHLFRKMQWQLKTEDSRITG